MLIIHENSFDIEAGCRTMSGEGARIYFNKTSFIKDKNFFFVFDNRIESPINWLFSSYLLWFFQVKYAERKSSTYTSL
jgi:hypothetical protein